MSRKRPHKETCVSRCQCMHKRKIIRQHPTKSQNILLWRFRLALRCPGPSAAPRSGAVYGKNDQEIQDVNRDLQTAI